MLKLSTRYNIAGMTNISNILMLGFVIALAAYQIDMQYYIQQLTGIQQRETCIVGFIVIVACISMVIGQLLVLVREAENEIYDLTNIKYTNIISCAIISISLISMIIAIRLCALHIIKYENFELCKYLLVGELIFNSVSCCIVFHGSKYDDD